MTVITTRLLVSAEGSVSIVDHLTAGEYTATIEIGDGISLPPRPFRIEDLPVHGLAPWPEGARWGRDEIYGDDGR